jgi:hypothetical protein
VRCNLGVTYTLPGISKRLRDLLRVMPVVRMEGVSCRMARCGSTPSLQRVVLRAFSGTSAVLSLRPADEDDIPTPIQA